MMFSTGLKEHHELEAFDCEVEGLNRWLHNEARRADNYDSARTYVWTPSATEHNVVGYFTFLPTVIARDELTKSQAANYRTAIPGFLLAKLALDRSLKGQGLGRELLVDAIGRLVGAAEAGGGMVIVLDVVSEEIATFYRKYGFVDVQKTENRLVMKMATTREIALRSKT
jgi:predicted N-acetyltransferase YhbS